MTKATLTKQYKASQKRLMKAIKAYKALARKVYLLQDDGSFVSLAKLVITATGCLNTHNFMALRRYYNGNVTLYRMARGGKAYVEAYTDCKFGRREDCTQCNFCNGQSCDDYGGEFFCRDYQTILDIESAIEDELYVMANRVDDLRQIGVDIYKEDEFWQ